MKKFIILILMLSLCSVSYSQNMGDAPGDAPGFRPEGRPDGKFRGEKPQKPPKPKKQKKVEEEEEIGGKQAGQVYVFGCSSEFGDSTIYFTDIQMVDSLVLTKKTKFLPYRSDFSIQLKDKLESAAIGAANQTACVFFSDKKAKLEKKYAKLKKRYITKHKMNIVTLDQEKFRYVHPLDYASPSN